MEKINKKNIVCDIAVILIAVLVIVILLAICEKKHIERSNENLRAKSYCDSVGGILSADFDKCYVSGQEIKIGGN